MKILMRQFLGKLHSWSNVGWSVSRSLIQMGHQVDLFSTDGIEHFPADLKNNLIGYHVEKNPQSIFGSLPTKTYDCQISYTSMRNFPYYLSHGDKNRLGIWCYEWAGKNVLPTGFAKAYNFCDYICPPSQFAKQVFMDSGVPEKTIKVISHGIHANDFKKDTTIKLPTNKKYKILTVLAQNHLRKGIPLILEAYGKAFTNKDDVTLIIKGKEKPLVHPFDVSLKEELQKFYTKYPQHGEIKLFSDFVNDMSDLYRSVDTVYNLPYCEGFFMPGLEAIAAGKLVIAPNWGGQLDFLNFSNALLVDGKETRADPRSMYWESKPNAIWFQPSVDDAVDKLKYAYQNYENLNKNIEMEKNNVYSKYDWLEITRQYMELCK